MKPLKPVYASTAMLAAALRANDEKAIDYVKRVLKRHKGNATETAAEIGVGFSTLRRWQIASSALKEAMAPHALDRAAAGKLGGRKGGPARARKLSPSERQAVASDGGRARAEALSPAERRRIGQRGGRPRSRAGAVPE